MKSSLLLILPVAALAFTSCTTLQNRRDMYFPQKVNGPYTRMINKWDSTRHARISTGKKTSGKTTVSSDGKNYVAPQK